MILRLTSSNYTKGEISVEAAIQALTDGLREGMKQNPQTRVYQILCHMRASGSQKCFEVADLASSLYDRQPGGVLALDIAGPGEEYQNNTLYIPCYKYAKKLGLNTTVHSGEPQEMLTLNIFELRFLTCPQIAWDTDMQRSTTLLF